MATLIKLYSLPELGAEGPQLARVSDDVFRFATDLRDRMLISWDTRDFCMARN
jgi:hypothetical protein